MSTVSVSLPSDGSNADVSDYNAPITTIVNEFNGNIDNNNIKSGAAIATSKLADDAGITSAKLATGSVEGAKLSTSAITLGYAQITGNFTTTSTSQVQVTGLTAAVTIPAGGRRVKITAYAPDLQQSSSTGSIYLGIWDGAVNTGTQLTISIYTPNSANTTSPIVAMAVVTPSAGAKTYNVSIKAGSGTATLEAGATYPAFILVEAI